jgi:hypothetical protein
MGVDPNVFPQKFFIDYVRYTPYDPSIECNQINWQGNWAFGCDFYNHDLTSVRIPAYECGPRCLLTTGCTHFSWTWFEGGTCWMKTGAVSTTGAFPVNDQTAIGGFV